MDRNPGMNIILCITVLVALRKESVDRNLASWSAVLTELVALRKESVDRNQGVHYDNYNLHVALRKESVDRNYYFPLHAMFFVLSLSARRAWIEIIFILPPVSISRRSPQGERG